MFKFFCSIPLAFLIATNCSAQLVNSEKNLFTEDTFFNEDFILCEKIKSITGAFHYKRDNEKMHDKGVIVKYEFDTLGRLKRQYSTFKKYGGETDTSFVFYEYDNDGRLSTKRTSDNFGFYSMSYTYDKNGNIIQETYSRELNANHSAGDFSLGKQYPMGVEKFEFDYISPVFYKKKLLNNLGVPFKEISFLMNELGKVTEETGTFLSIRHVERKNYTYNEKGKLIEKTEFTDLGQALTIQYQYVYDKNDQLIEIKKLKNTEPVQITEFMLNNNGLITNRLSREITAQIIDITKFSYEFY